MDNPQLNARLWSGNQPVRLVLDKELQLNPDLHLFDGEQRTIVFTEKEKLNQDSLEFIQVSFDENLPNSISKSVIFKLGFCKMANFL